MTAHARYLLWLFAFVAGLVIGGLVFRVPNPRSLTMTVLAAPGRLDLVDRNGDVVGGVDFTAEITVTIRRAK